MEKNRLKIYHWLPALLFLLASCRASDPFWNVLNGNARFNKGDYTGATVSYMKALEQNPSPQWIYYNLGNAYNALGEIEPAIQQLTKAGEEKNPELLYRTNFNLGEIYYELGNFENAINYFKEALKAKPRDIDAKINLEISIKNYTSMLDTAGAAAAGAAGQNDKTEKNWNDLLEDLQKQEEKTWKMIKEGPTASDTEDW